MGDLAQTQAAAAEAFRSDWGSVVAYLIRVTGNWDLAEECAQDAFERALERWPRDGIPTSPRRLAKTTARNRALDRLRRTGVGEAKLKEVAMTARATRAVTRTTAAICPGSIAAEVSISAFAASSFLVATIAFDARIGTGVTASSLLIFPTPATGDLTVSASYVVQLAHRQGTSVNASTSARPTARNSALVDASAHHLEPVPLG